MAMLAIFLFLAELVALGGAASGKVEHTFVVSQVSMVHLCKETLVTVVNGQLPGPTIEVEEGDSLAIHIVNKSPYGLTIHWHGVTQRLNCWADGVGMITQCPIQPNNNFTYRFDVAGHEGTLWWHAHVYSLRATVHGTLVIHPKSPSSSYPFAKPDGEIPIIIGTTMEDNYILDVEHGNTYLMRVVNAALFSEYYLKVAGHTFTVVAVDANYVKPYSTDIIAIAPGETVDALLVADAPPGRYYMVAQANEPVDGDIDFPVFTAMGIVQYNNNPDSTSTGIIPSPQMPGQNDTISSFHFHGNLTSLVPHPRFPQLVAHADERMFILLSLGSLHCKPDHAGSPCSPSLWVASDSFLVASMNNISFQLPQTMPLLEAHYYKSMTGVEELPDRPAMMYNFTDQVGLKPSGSRATIVKRFRHNTVVDVVFQSTGVGASSSNPMHLHGHDVFVLAQGLGNYDAASDMKRYNLVDPPLRNTILVPRLGWAAIRFVADNPGVWFLHCHYGYHLSSGMAAAFVIQDGPTLNTSLPPPPIDLPAGCGKHNTAVE